MRVELSWWDGCPYKGEIEKARFLSLRPCVATKRRWPRANQEEHPHQPSDQPASSSWTSASRTVRNKWLLFKTPSPWYFCYSHQKWLRHEPIHIVISFKEETGFSHKIKILWIERNTLQPPPAPNPIKFVKTAYIVSIVQAIFNFTWARCNWSVAKIAMSQLVLSLRERWISIYYREDTEDMAEGEKALDSLLRDLKFPDLALNPSSVICQLFDLGKDAQHLWFHLKICLIVQN